MVLLVQLALLEHSLHWRVVGKGTTASLASRYYRAVEELFMSVCSPVAGTLQVDVVPWAATHAADCQTVLRRRASLDRLGSQVVLQAELLALLQGADPPLQAADRGSMFLRASFRPDAPAGEGHPLGAHACSTLAPGRVPPCRLSYGTVLPGNCML